MKAKNVIVINENEYRVVQTSLLNVFKSPFGKYYFKRRVRMFFQSIRKSVALVLVVNDTPIGYTVFERGGSLRYPFCTKKDWLISPYVVGQDYRGKGFGNMLMKDSICFFQTNLSGRLFALVSEENVRSLRVISHFDFRPIEKYKNCGGITRKYKQYENGEYVLYRLGS